MAPRFDDPALDEHALAVEAKTKGTITNKSECRSCSAEIFWVALPSGKKGPYDADPTGEVTSHFATCPHANQHRKAKG